MKVTVFLLAALLVVAPSMGLQAMRKTLPVFPAYTLHKWNGILSELCDGCELDAQPRTLLKVNDKRDEASPQIINGQRATPGQFPHQVGISMDDSYFCGGSIISEYVVLTAAHCVYGTRTFTIVFGELAPLGGSNTPIYRSTTTGTYHESYNSMKIWNDIGIISWTQAVKFNDVISPVKLPTYSDVSTNYNGKTATISGWGKTNDWSSVSNHLNWVDLLLVDNSVGAMYFGDSVRTSNLVADGSRYLATCSGDSGGALVVTEGGRMKQIGIVSYGAADGCVLGYPSVFTRVDSYLQWITMKSGVDI